MDNEQPDQSLIWVIKGVRKPEGDVEKAIIVRKLVPGMDIMAWELGWEEEGVNLHLHFGHTLVSGYLN